MKKVKVISIILGLTMLAGALGACSSKGSGKLTDGSYKVEYDNFDSHGYKGQLELTVSGGKISDVKYDEVSKDGKFKSQDADYKKKMEEASKTYPEKAYNELEQSLLTKQSADVDTVTGATSATNNFKTLAKYAIDEMAKTGKTGPATVPAPKE